MSVKTTKMDLQRGYMALHCGQASRTLKNTVKPAALFLVCASNRALTVTGAESGLNGCKEAVIPAFPLHFLF